MKVRKFVQILLGIISLLLALVLVGVAVLVLVPQLFQMVSDVAIVSGILKSIHDTSTKLATLVGLDAIGNMGEFVVNCIIFALPAILMVNTTFFLLFGKKRATVKVGGILGIIAMVVFAGITSAFAKSFLGADLAKHSVIYILCAIGATLLYGFLAIVTMGGKKQVKQTEEVVEENVIAEDNAEQQVAEENKQVVPVEQNDEKPVEVNEEKPVEVVEEKPVVVPQEPVVQEELFVPQEQTTVSQVREQTYSNAGTLDDKSKQKLAKARALYQSGIITKEHFLAILKMCLSPDDKN